MVTGVVEDTSDVKGVREVIDLVAITPR